jgi:chromosome partitioning protein
MAAILTLAQRKGGAGKTTLAIHLAVGWRRAGRRVAMIDVDPQGSLAQWAELRRAALEKPEEGFSVTAVSGWRLVRELDRARREADFVIVDSPPHAELDSRAAIRAADLVVVPVQPSPLDAWATRATLEAARAEKRPTLLVLNRVVPRARLTQEIAAELAAGVARLATASLGSRTAFAASIAAGTGVEDHEPGSAAAGEIIHLRAEIEAILAERRD